MKIKIKVLQEVEITYAACQIFARYWEDSDVNGVEDDCNNPQMPCVKEVNHFYYKKPRKAWCPIINLKTGQIENWKKGVTASIHYKSCDENVVILRNGYVACDEVKKYIGYVPNFLCPKECGCGDYVIMDIDENGFIQGFNNNLDDILNEED